MNDRGKAQQQNNNNGDLLLHDDSSSYCLPCKRHPSSSPAVGICPHCLKERLLSLVCSDCGEHRLSSCSCSINNNHHLLFSPTRTSVSSNVDVGSVGRVSVLIENDASSQSQSQSFYRPNNPKSNRDTNSNNNEVLILKRSSSSCVEIKRRKGGGFWKIGRFFTTKRSNNKNKGGSSGISHSVAGIEDRNGDVWVLDDLPTGGGCGGAMVSRSRSLCSFRGGVGGFFGSEDGTYSGARSSVSGARSSISAARSSGFNGLVFDPDRKSGYSESEPRKSGFDFEKREPDGGECYYPTRRVFSLREGNLNFTTAHDSGFIDLKFDSDSKPPPTSEVSLPAGDYYPRSSELGAGDGRIAVNDRGIKRSRKSFKSWRWIFRHHHHSSSSDQHHMGWKKKDGGGEKISSVVKAL